MLYFPMKIKKSDYQKPAHIVDTIIAPIGVTSKDEKKECQRSRELN